MAAKRPRKQHTPCPLSRRALLLCAAVLALIALAAWLWAGSSRFPRLEVDGRRITQEEYLFAMYQARNEVLSDHAAASLSLTDWSRESPLGDPRQLTMDRALEILKETYAVSTLAVERGYLTDGSFEAMKQDMEQVNRQRQEALEDGSVVTGFPSFTMEDYVSYRASSLRLQFCSDPDNPENQVTPEELRQRYEADKINLYQQPDGMELAFVELEAGTDQLEQALLALRQQALELSSLAAAVAEHPQLSAYYQEISLQPGTYGFYERSFGDVLACADGLRSGELSQVIRQGNWLCLVQCLKRTDHTHVPLEDVESIVAQSIRESRYDALIAERKAHTAVTGNLRALYRFTSKQLPN